MKCSKVQCIIFGIFVLIGQTSVCQGVLADDEKSDSLISNSTGQNASWDDVATAVDYGITGTELWTYALTGSAQTAGTVAVVPAIMVTVYRVARLTEEIVYLVNEHKNLRDSEKKLTASMTAESFESFRNSQVREKFRRLEAAVLDYFVSLRSLAWWADQGRKDRIINALDRLIGEENKWPQGSAEIRQPHPLWTSVLTIAYSSSQSIYNSYKIFSDEKPNYIRGNAVTEGLRASLFDLGGLAPAKFSFRITKAEFDQLILFAKETKEIAENFFSGLDSDGMAQMLVLDKLPKLVDLAPDTFYYLVMYNGENVVTPICGGMLSPVEGRTVYKMEPFLTTDDRQEIWNAATKRNCKKCSLLAQKCKSEKKRYTDRVSTLRTADQYFGLFNKLMDIIYREYEAFGIRREDANFRMRSSLRSKGKVLDRLRGAQDSLVGFGQLYSSYLSQPLPAGGFDEYIGCLQFLEQPTSYDSVPP